MFTIDLVLKTTPIPLSVERKEESAAQALYRELLAAVAQTPAHMIELTCEKQTEKKVAVLSSEIVGIQLSQKGAAGSSGRGPGFFAQLLEQS
ncbi:hypothetical protein [Synechococcus sp. PCC 6312]|uniref:hypothetical protein n=1 Tax=Synechococcus sp. (strain ATCC 27167 / PCC 6312) TaxID=195253 RepID=UPI00029F1B51|nr:hypothetical protein [Synechococcus sp. PCC 6312]AFY60476.1 hypothetical protein Syn6312_1296 [Synechococcus sp. PCC 6312]